MATFMERDYSNGKVTIQVDGRHVELVFVGQDGRVEAFHCEGTSARLAELMTAVDGEVFDPDLLHDWELGSLDDGLTGPASWS
ncbi:hypothetical protein [Saccharothrix sp. HUAS TT1]|uniref:hypothetical protein n=1 Tax=unclassified Saccharothrix TaxID=2593673 RepID=UPI00345BAC36